MNKLPLFTNAKWRPYGQSNIVYFEDLNVVVLKLNEVIETGILGNTTASQVTIDSCHFSNCLPVTITNVQELAEYLDASNFCNGGSGSSNIRRADYVGLISYNGYAPTGSFEDAAVWTITKITTDVSGNVVSSVQTLNWKWTERSLL